MTRKYKITYVSIETGRTIGTEKVIVDKDVPQHEHAGRVREIGTRTAEAFTRTEGNVRWSFTRG